MALLNPLDRTTAVQGEAALRHARLCALILLELSTVELAHERGHATLSTASGLAPWPRQTHAYMEHGRALANRLRLVWNWSLAYDTRSSTWTYGHALDIQAPPGPGQASLSLARVQTDTDDNVSDPWAFTIAAAGNAPFAANLAHLVAAIPPETPEHGTAHAALVAKLRTLERFGQTVALKDDEAWLCIAAILNVCKNPYTPL